MEVQLINKGTTGELVLHGRLDSSAAGKMEEIFVSVASRFEHVILNLTDMEYTSSAGLRLILNLQRSMNEKGGILEIRGAGKMVMEVFEMTGFASFLKFI